MKLTKNEYIEILNFYNINFNSNMPIKLIRKSVEKIIATKLCRCIKKVNNETHESRAIGICNKSVIKNKNLGIYKHNLNALNKSKVQTNIELLLTYEMIKQIKLFFKSNKHRTQRNKKNYKYNNNFKKKHKI